MRWGGGVGVAEVCGAVGARVVGQRVTEWMRMPKASLDPFTFAGPQNNRILLTWRLSPSK